MRDLNAWLDRKKPYQREVLFAAAFDLGGLILLVTVILGAALLCPWLSTPAGLVILCAASGAAGIGVAVTTARMKED